MKNENQEKAKKIQRGLEKGPAACFEYSWQATENLHLTDLHLANSSEIAAGPTFSSTQKIIVSIPFWSRIWIFKNLQSKRYVYYFQILIIEHELYFDTVICYFKGQIMKENTRYQIQVRLQKGFASVVEHTVRSVRKMSNPLIALFPFLTTRPNPL